jgi:hypothetical protein
MPDPTVAILWRGDAAARRDATPANSRFHSVFAALARAGIRAEPAVYDESFAGEVRAQLLRAAGVLVWVDPLHDGKTRAALDPLLREVAAQGPWVSAHPDTIRRMGTKEVLFRTRHLGWGADTDLYPDAAAFRARFPPQLAADGTRVLKRNRGNGGQGVWKVERLGPGAGPGDPVRVLHARRGSAPEDTTLGAFMAFAEAYFDEPDGAIVDQAFQPRLPEGMIRCYVSADRVAGFGHQLIKALVPPPPSGPDSPEAQPGPRIMSGPDAPAFQALRRAMEDEWIPGMARTLGLARDDLPAIWDADFLFGPRTAAGADTYVLCEINVSSVFAIPDEAPDAIARWVRARLGGSG